MFSIRYVCTWINSHGVFIIRHIPQNKVIIVTKTAGQRVHRFGVLDARRTLGGIVDFIVSFVFHRPRRQPGGGGGEGRGLVGAIRQGGEATLWSGVQLVVGVYIHSYGRSFLPTKRSLVTSFRLKKKIVLQKIENR